jgi:hypothetical protein
MWKKASEELPEQHAEVIVACLINGEPQYAVASVTTEDGITYWDSAEDWFHGLLVDDYEVEVYWSELPAFVIQ